MADNFENQTPEQIYAQLSPEQRAAIAAQFQQGLAGSDHPDAQTLTSVDPQSATAEQVAAMHKHASQYAKNVFGTVMNHPVATAALGGFAIYELDKHLRDR